MRIIMAYISPNSTTRRVSDELGKHFANDGHEFIALDIGKIENCEYETIDWSIFKEADLLGIASPVYHMSVFEAMHQFLETALPQIRKQNSQIKAFAIITYAGITSGKALLNIASVFKENSIGLAGALKIKAPHFWHLENYPDSNAKDFIRRFYDELCQKRFDLISWERTKRLFTYQKMRIKIMYPFARKIGSRRKQPIHILEEKCVKCSRCVKECPVHAIVLNEYAVRDAEKCAYCYHCSIICPKDAIILNTEKVKQIVEFNKKAVGLEQPPDQIFI